MVHIIDLNFQGHPGTIAAFLVETAEGPVLVESGPATTLDALEVGLRGKGVDLAEIQHVFLTHIHFDHAGAAWRFAELGATIHVHPFGQSHLADPEVLWKSAKRVFGEDMERLWGEMRGIPTSQLHVYEDGESFSLGDRTFTALHTPGHAKHHIAWQLDEEVIFAGDVAGVSLDGGPVQAPSPPPDIDLEAWTASIERLQESSADRLYLTHYGEVSEKESHLAELQGCLDEWCDWMAVHLQSAEPAALVPKFAGYVRKQLQQRGLSEAALADYEVVNPAQMSVYGLARYLSKKRNLDS